MVCGRVVASVDATAQVHRAKECVDDHFRQQGIDVEASEAAAKAASLAAERESTSER